MTTSRVKVQRRRAVVRALLAWLVAAFFLVVAVAQDVQQLGLRLLWAGLALVWLMVGARSLIVRPQASPAAPVDAAPTTAPDQVP